MNYIEYLKSLSVEERHREIKSKVLNHQRDLLNDKSRIGLLDDETLNCWDEIDELTLQQVDFDDVNHHCIAEVYWISYGPKDEDDERFLSGNAMAILSDDERIKFSKLSAELDGELPPKKMENVNSEEVLQRQQDEQDYIEYLTKDC